MTRMNVHEFNHIRKGRVLHQVGLQNLVKIHLRVGPKAQLMFFHTFHAPDPQILHSVALKKKTTVTLAAFSLLSIWSFAQKTAAQCT